MSQQSIRPLVSIIVPCYNQGKYLPETLDSILKQSYNEWECIIINDGSSDNTEDVALKYCNIDTRIKYIRQNNKGLSSARNSGIRNCNGKYILPLDSDDLIGSTYIEKAINIIENNDKIKIVYCRAKLFGEIHKEWNLPQYSLEKILGSNCIFCTALYSKEDFLKTKGYNTNMKYGFEDWDFWLSLIELDPSCQVYQLDEILFYYRIRKKSMARQLDQEKYSYLRKQIWINHQQLYSNFFYSPIDSFEYQQITNSFEYKIGKLIIKPIQFILKIFA